MVIQTNSILVLRYSPISLVAGCGCEQTPSAVEQDVEAARKGGVEVVARPGHPVVSVVDVGVRVVPGPPQQLDTHDVERHIKKHHRKTHWNNRLWAFYFEYFA